jgi:hypothetical protein
MSCPRQNGASFVQLAKNNLKFKFNKNSSSLGYGIAVCD